MFPLICPSLHSCRSVRCTFLSCFVPVLLDSSSFADDDAFIKVAKGKDATGAAKVAKGKAATAKVARAPKVEERSSYSKVPLKGEKLDTAKVVPKLE